MKVRYLDYEYEDEHFTYGHIYECTGTNPFGFLKVIDNAGETFECNPNDFESVENVVYGTEDGHLAIDYTRFRQRLSRLLNNMDIDTSPDEPDPWQMPESVKHQGSDDEDEADDIKDTKPKDIDDVEDINDFAVLTDIPVQRLQAYITGISEPTLRDVINISGFLNVSMNWMLGLSDYNEGGMPTKEELIAKAYSYATDTEKKEINRILGKYLVEE